MLIAIVFCFSLLMISCRPVEPPLWTGLILDRDLTNWNKDFWQGEQVEIGENMISMNNDKNAPFSHFRFSTSVKIARWDLITVKTLQFLSRR